MTVRVRDCDGPEQTAAIGRELASGLAQGGLVSLEGELGAGKTVFARGVAEGLGIDPARVHSPSFVLATEYDGSPGLLHADLYRLGEGAGIDDLGIEEALDEGRVVLVEWGERMPPLLLRSALRVRLTHDPGDPLRRRITLLDPEPG